MQTRLSFHKKQPHSVFHTTFYALLFLLLVELIMLFCFIVGCGIPEKLTHNAEDIFSKQVESRSSEIENFFTRAQELSTLANQINEITIQMLDSGEITLEDLDQNSTDSVPLLQQLTDVLISDLRSKSVTGIFVVLNTHNLDELQDGAHLPGIYLRDLDPDTPASERNQDLSFEFAPTDVVRTMEIYTDTCWEPALHYNRETCSFLYEPFQVAYQDHSILDARDYGRWTTQPFTLPGSNRQVIAYSQPLILSDGTVYGVVGVELTLSYLCEKLPFVELQGEDSGSYLLAYTTDDILATEVTLQPVLASSHDSTIQADSLSPLSYQANCSTIDGSKYYVSFCPLSLYNRNAPFSGEQWLLVGLAPHSQLFAFPSKVHTMLMLTVLLMLFIGTLCSIFVSRKLSRPIAQLSAEVLEAQRDSDRIPHLSPTGIRELDQFSDAFTQLSQEILETSTKFLLVDILTGLQNRVAFERHASDLFKTPALLKHTALLMLDMDHLKRVNDTFGHEWGDRCICLVAQYIQENAPSQAILSRLSGDEFLLLLYGYETQDALRQDILHLADASKNYSITLSNGDIMPLQISGGVTWYPEDSTDLPTLRKYADFAMCQAKRTHKGSICEFDPDTYRQSTETDQLRREFMQMLSENLAFYHFQPIFDAHSGCPAAYEALLRVNLPLLRNPALVMKLARENQRLYDVEYMTFFKATEAFQKTRDQGLLDPNAKLFLNSVANVHLTEQDFIQYQAQFENVMHQLVVEITEEEELDEEAFIQKKKLLAGRGVFALDDYGSGHSNSANLLRIAPAYVKIDMSIIRDIDRSDDKQQLVKNILAYAHPRQMQVVAEGIETPEELQCVIQLGVDLLQGYFLSRPAVVPAPLSDSARTVIERMQKKLE